jgi:DNA-binding response OmpR family regulator
VFKYLIHLLLVLKVALHLPGGDYRRLRKMVKRVLVVDDESDVCFGLHKVLSDNRFVVDSYEDPLLALSKFKAHSYSLVILDIRMPELNGFALYREIKRLDKKVRVCFLTAGEMYYGVYSDIFSSLPANHFIRKPIGNEELIKRINEIIIDDTSIGLRPSDELTSYVVAK